MDTERLIIRRFTPDDWAGLFEYLSDEKVVEFEPYPPLSLEQCKQAAIERSRSDDFWAVCLKDSGKLVGNLYFHEGEFNTWELGYVFNRAHHGMGYASESASRILRYGFEERSAHRITAYCSPLNAPSWKLLARIGMRREALFLKNVYFKLDERNEPVWLDSYAYAMLAEEWMHTKISKLEN